MNGKGKPSKKETQKLLSQRLTEIDSGKYREIQRATFEEFTQLWMTRYLQDVKFVKSSTAGTYPSAMRSRLLPFFGHYSLTNLTPGLIQSFVSELSEDGLSTHSIHNCLTSLTTMLKRAVKWGYHQTSPMQLVDRPKLRHEERPILTPDQLRKFLEHVDDEWHTFFLVMAMQ